MERIKVIKMNLKVKMLSLSLIPMVLIGISMFLVAANRMQSGIYDEAYVGMYATTLAIRDIFEIGYEGEYRMDDNGELWKGEEFNISQAEDIVDHIKGNTGLEVTIFWNDTRVLTSIIDDKGNRQVGTKASEEVIRRVLKEGEPYKNRNVDILGTEYVVYYVPIYQVGTEEAVGMIFLGTPQETVYSIIHRAKIQLLAVVAMGVVFTAIVVYYLVNSIVSLLYKNMDFLGLVSQGKLNIRVDSSILQRKDEIGGIGRSIDNLKDKLGSIVEGIKAESDRFHEESENLKDISEEVYHIIKEVDCSAQEMAKSCMNQAEGASHASRNVTEMGEMIKDNSYEVMKINDIAVGMKEVSQEAMGQFMELNEVMGNVKESIHILMEQAGLTETSVNKISAATELITVIASKTKLLSLNASIEAARVGEAGRGFAVVASEIQDLSEQSNTAAGKIKEIVADLNMNTSHTLDRVEDMKNVIDMQEGNIKRTNDSFRSVRKGIDETVNGMEDIMRKVEKLEEIRTNTVAIVQNAAAVSEENSASVEEIMASIGTVYQNIEGVSKDAKVLNELSQEMRAKVNVFVL